jgi:hypothetical protein
MANQRPSAKKGATIIIYKINMKKDQNQSNARLMLKLIGQKAPLWKELRTYLSEHYDHEPITSTGKKEYDWTIRYRKSGKTLVTLMPEKDNFCILVVLGKEEIKKAKDIELNAFIKNIFETAKQFHDGRWLWIRPHSSGDIESVKALLAVKKKPKRQDKP